MVFDMQIIKQGLDFERQKNIRLTKNEEYKILKKKMQDIKINLKMLDCILKMKKLTIL